LEHLALRPLDPQYPPRQNGLNAARSDVQAMRYAMSGIIMRVCAVQLTIEWE
jgi:hypothetical protein